MVLLVGSADKVTIPYISKRYYEGRDHVKAPPLTQSSDQAPTRKTNRRASFPWRAQKPAKNRGKRP